MSQPVQLHGTFVEFFPAGRYGFLLDETACILARVTNAPPELAAGKLVEFEGWTEAGWYAPLVHRGRVRILGESSIPSGRKLAVARMKAGEGCWQWVRIEGVVRDMNRDVPNLAVSVASENQRFSAFLTGYDRFRGHGLPLDWLEARVVMDGICWIDVNERDQPVDFRLLITHTNQIHFLRKGTTNLFGLGEMPLAVAPLLRRPSDDRIRLAATVLSVFPDDRLFLRTAFGPVQARLYRPISSGTPETELVPRQPPEAIAAGDRIELVGAPAESRFAPLLVDVEYRRTTAGEHPTAQPVSFQKLMDGEYDAELVRVAGRLLAHDRRQLGPAVEEFLVLERAGTVFEAAWLSDTTNALPSFPRNARLELSGICVVQPGPGNLLRTFKLLLRSPADVRFLGQTPFWLLPGVSRVLWIGTGLGAACALWVWLLRRKVRDRTAALATANASLSNEIEQRRKAQAELHQSLAKERELSDLKSRFVSLVSHEFRTPLGITMSAVELLRSYLDRLPPEKLKQLLEDIYSSTVRMSGLMEQVLLLGRVEAGKLACNTSSFDLADFARKQIDEMLSATSRRCPINLVLKGELSGARGDEALLRHVCSNLLSNSVKYSPAGSPVEFGIQRDRESAIFTVADRGVGIPKADQPRLFEAFHRGSNAGEISGTGLGLLIVRRCVEVHQGTIEFLSSPETGTTFTVRLPLFSA